MSDGVVITGLGAVTPFGVGASALWDGLLEGRSALTRIARFDPSGFDCRLAGEAEGFSARDFVPKAYRKAVKVMARDIELAVGAAHDAVRDAGLSTRGQPLADGADPTYPPRRVGCHIGAGLIAADLDELTAALASGVDERGEFSLARWGDAEGGAGAMGNLTPLWLLKYLPNMLACHVTIIHDAQGPSNTITCAEASGLLSVGESMRVIERGEADACFTGGAENKVTPMGLVRMGLAGRLAATGDEADGSRVVRPYDPASAGGLLGEAGGIVVAERESTARARGARVYARLVGAGSGHAPRSDDPAVRARGLANAIRAALRNAGLEPADVGAILPHASGVPSLDAEEAEALRAVFGGSLASIPLVTLTPAIGDAMAGFGGVATAVAALCLHHRTLPARLHAGAPAEGLDAGPAPARDAAVSNALVCAGALGGQAAAIVLSSA
ncbi:MAG: hypothetical protein D6693_04665 [Planctomycetota bacterium]|nr:MAG: hypothetical protein D6693_04665 [Planctomycetota bacterium]